MKCIAPKLRHSKSLLHVHRDFAGVMDSIREARSWTTRTLTEHGFEPPEWVELLVSELTTNAVTHTLSSTPNSSFRLKLSVHADRVHVAVFDAGPLPGRVPTRLDALPHATHGRGLALVDTFASLWGTVTHGVWAEVPR